MKINAITKEAILKCDQELHNLEAKYKEKEKEVVRLVSCVTGEKGFIGYEIKEDELILKFPDVKE
jgi:hypothetical protein